MKSRTKNLLTEQKIRELVHLHFGETCEVSSIEELKGGMFNAIYLIGRKREQDKIVLKVGVVPGTPLLTYERDVMPTEVECFRLVREQTSVPVPKVLAYDFSKTHINSNYFFMTALEGIALSSVSKKMDKNNLNQVKAELAGYLAQFHSITGPYFGYFTQDPEQQFSTWKEAFSHMFEQLLRDAQERNTKLPYVKIRQALSENAYCLEELKAPALVEYDCHEGNIFVKQVNGVYQIEGILDLERAFWGDPIGDFPTAFVFTDDIRKEPAFLNAYLKASGKNVYTDADAKRYQLYRLYILTIMAAEVFRYDFLYAKLQGAWARWNISKCLKELI